MKTLRAVAKPVAPANDDLVPLARSVGYHVRQLAETWQDAMDVAAVAHGVTISQWRYLRELWEDDGLSIGELTRRVGRQGPTTVVAVRLLERTSLVTVTKSDTDRRRSVIRLTPRGRRLAATMAPLIRAVNERAMSDLSDAEIRTFKRLMVRIQRRLNADMRARNEWGENRTDRLAQEVGLYENHRGGAYAAIHHHPSRTGTEARGAGAKRATRARRDDRQIRASLR